MEYKPKVAVIMATYNGEKFIRTQIDSILAQKDVDVSLFIFDDRSNDATVDIIKEYEQKYPNIKLSINEKNKRFTYNFLDGLFTFKDNVEFDFYAFSDQDDYWLDDKLITAVNMIKSKGECCLYSSNLKVVDKDLNYSGQNVKADNYTYTRYWLLRYCAVTGCTVVFDKAFKNLVTKHYPHNIYAHDYWVSVVANFCKGVNVIYDNNPSHILYRQHGNNEIGFHQGKGNLFTAALGVMFKKVPPDRLNSRWIDELITLYDEDIYEEDKKLLYKLANIKKLRNKFWVLFNAKCFSWKFKLRLFIGKY